MSIKLQAAADASGQRCGLQAQRVSSISDPAGVGSGVSANRSRMALWYKVSIVSQCPNQLKDAAEMGHSARNNWDMSLRLSSFHRLLQQMVPVAVGWFQDVTASAAVVELVGCGGPPPTISSS